jgi:hypothetical protein
VPLGLAAAAVLAVLSTWPNRSPQPEVEATSNGVAVLTGSSEVRWGAGQPALEPGAILPRGRIRISAGVLGIEFYGGARLTLQGPADLDLDGVDRVVCRQGRIRVQVAERARGFRVSTPKLDLIDLGTEFGVEVGAEERTELHVFTGKVELAQIRHAGASAATRELVTGQGLRFDEAGIASIPARSGQFVSQQDLRVRLQEQTRTRYEAWQAASRRLHADPRVVLYYDFQPAEAEERTLLNRSARHGHSLDGALVGTKWVDGRWPGKRALEFRQASDRVRVLVPGEFESLSYVAWLQVDSFENMFAAIFLTDGYDEGAVHWQFYRGMTRLGIAGDIVGAGRGRIGVNYDASEVEPAALLGRWRQLAVVVDGAKREVVHYLDGQAVRRTAIVKPQRLRLGNAELGNWGLPDTGAPHPIRNFNGRMDEFVVFNEALSDAEIAGLFEEGRPWPRPETLAGR